MGTEPAPLTLADAMHQAIRAVDPTGEDAGMGDLLARFEDLDEPIGTPEDAEQRIAEEVGALDPQGEDPAIQMAAAVATYLAYRRDESGHEPGTLLRLAARAEYDGDPPDNIREWLVDSGVEI